MGIGDLVGYTSKIGADDVEFGTGIPGETFTTVGASGGAVSKTKIPSLGPEKTSVIKGVYYLAASGISDHSATSGADWEAYNFARVLSLIGDDPGKIYIGSGTIDLGGNTLTVPKNVEIEWAYGAQVVNGTLSVLGGSTSFIVGGVDDLRAVAGSYSGQCVETAHHTSPGDNLGRMYEWIASSTEPDCNGAVVKATVETGRWHLKHKGVVMLSEFGCIKDRNDSNVIALNETNFRKAMAFGGQIYVDGDFTIELSGTSTIENDVSLFGDGLTSKLTFVQGITTSPRMFYTTSPRIVLKNLTLHGVAGQATFRLFDPATRTTLIERVEVDTCEFDYGCRFLITNFDPGVDPLVTRYGIREFIFRNSYIGNMPYIFTRMDDACSEIVSIRNNRIHNIDQITFCVGTTNGAAYADNVRSLMKNAVVCGNIVTQDLTFNPVNCVGDSLGFCLYEGVKLNFKDNIIDGIFTTTNADEVFDVYANNIEFFYKNNVKTNVIGLHASKPIGNVFHCKGSEKIYAHDNTITVGQDFFDYFGITLNSGKDWITLMDKTRSGGESGIVSIKRNKISVPSLLGSSSVMVVANMDISDNEFYFKRFTQNLFYFDNNSSDVSDYGNVSVDISRNKIVIDDVNTITRQGVSYTVARLFYFVHVGSKGIHKVVRMRENRFEIGSINNTLNGTASAALRAAETDMRDNDFVVSGTVSSTFKPFGHKQAGAFDITGNTVSMVTGNIPAIGFPTVVGGAKGKMSFDCKGLYQPDIGCYIDNPGSNIGIRVGTVVSKGAMYEGVYNAALTSYDITYTNTSGSPTTRAYSSPGNVTPDVKWGYDNLELLSPQISVYNSVTNTVLLKADNSNVTTGDQIALKFSLSVF